MKRLTAVLLLVLATAVPALADPTNDVKNAFLTTVSAKSYHFAVEGKSHAVDGDFVAPGKFHVTAGPMEMIMLDKTMYVKMQGTWHQFTFPGADMMMGSFMKVREMASHPDNLDVTDLGTKVVDGGPLHAYSVQSKGDSKPEIVYVNGGGYAVRVDVDGGNEIIRFSNFNGPIDIVAPI